MAVACVYLNKLESLDGIHFVYYAVQFNIKSPITPIAAVYMVSALRWSSLHIITIDKARQIHFRNRFGETSSPDGKEITLHIFGT